MVPPVVGNSLAETPLNPRRRGSRVWQPVDGPPSRLGNCPSSVSSKQHNREPDDLKRLIETRDRSRIEAYLRRDLPIHLYEIGDLDPFFWPSTTWFALENASGEIEALVLRYANPAGVTLLALDRFETAALDELVDCLRPQLPARFHAHFRSGLADRLAEVGSSRSPGQSSTDRRWRVEARVRSFKMFLAEPRNVSEIPASAIGKTDIVRFAGADLDELLAFYAQAYPGNWFDPRMLETGQYFGMRENGRIVAVAGVHVYSPEYRVAALGNIATLGSARGRGLATQVTAALCRSLLETVDAIGLNVHEDNPSAIRCYTRLGFVPVVTYEEVMMAEA